MMRGHKAAGHDMIEFAVPHSLAFTFFPHWVMDLRERFAGLKTRPIALNVHDAVLHLTEGSCDLLTAYHHPSQPLQLNPDRYEMHSLGHETLIACAKADAAGQPLFRLPGSPGHGVPFLSCAEGACLGRLVEQIARPRPCSAPRGVLVFLGRRDGWCETCFFPWIEWACGHARGAPQAPGP